MNQETGSLTTQKLKGHFTYKFNVQIMNDKQKSQLINNNQYQKNKNDATPKTKRKGGMRPQNK